MTCKDCVYFKRCVGLGVELNIKQNKEADKNCRHFKDKADFVEVVRCSECQYYCAEYCTRDIKGRTNMFYMQPDDFCSYGERKND